MISREAVLVGHHPVYKRIDLNHLGRKRVITRAEVLDNICREPDAEAYLYDYAQEFAWREDVRRLSEGEKLADLLARVFKNGLSKWWRGYWQGNHRPGEYELVGA